jgi:DNA-binding Lrp family transcriptional regulator
MIPTKDLMILTELRNNSRETLTNMSRNISVPVSTIFDKIRHYNGNLIVKHTTIIDFTRLGFNARANIMVKVDKGVRDEAKRFLANHQNINSVYKVSNGFDFLAEGIFKNVKDVEDFLEYFESKFKLDEVEVYYVIEDIKKEGFMNDKGLLDIVT